MIILLVLISIVEDSFLIYSAQNSFKKVYCMILKLNTATWAFNPLHETKAYGNSCAIHCI